MTGPVRALERPANVLVTGARSGIGLAMTRQLLESPHVAHVLAIARHASGSPDLAALAERHGSRLQPVDADLTRETDLRNLAGTVGQTCPELHLVIHAAGLLHDDDVHPEKSIRQLRLAALQRVFAINAFAPALLAQALWPLLGHGHPAVFASLSARVGSIGDNRLGGWYAYRASKAAQNQLLRTLAIELHRHNRNATCLLLHPGTVDTPLSRPYQSRVPPDKLFEPERAARQLLDIIAASGPDDSGRFIAWDGRDIPW